MQFRIVFMLAAVTFLGLPTQSYAEDLFKPEREVRLSAYLRYEVLNSLRNKLEAGGEWSYVFQSNVVMECLPRSYNLGSKAQALEKSFGGALSVMRGACMGLPLAFVRHDSIPNALAKVNALLKGVTLEGNVVYFDKEQERFKFNPLEAKIRCASSCTYSVTSARYTGGKTNYVVCGGEVAAHHLSYQELDTYLTQIGQREQCKPKSE